MGGRVEFIRAHHHMVWNTDRTGLFEHGPSDGLANPPVSIGDKLQAATRLELVERPYETRIPFLDQVEQWHAPPAIAFDDMRDQAQIGVQHLCLSLRQLPLGAHPAAGRRAHGGLLGPCSQLTL